MTLYPDLKGEDTITEDCARCMGLGVITWGNVKIALHHKDGSISSDRYCFECMGRGKIDRKIKNIRAAAARQTNKRERESQHLRAAEARNNELARQVAGTRAKFEAEEPEMAALAQSLKGEFGDAVRENIEDAGRPRENLHKVLTRILEEAKSEPTPADVVEGRGVLTGVVKTIKIQESMYGVTVKMLLLEDRGFKVWGTLPSSLDGDVEKGDRVTLTATVEASKDDATFGFASRPTKASKI